MLDGQPVSRTCIITLRDSAITVSVENFLADLLKRGRTRFLQQGDVHPCPFSPDSKKISDGISHSASTHMANFIVKSVETESS